jgi:hypothetical protein
LGEVIKILIEKEDQWKTISLSSIQTGLLEA